MPSAPFARSLGVLHPTFEVWGGAEWFIHQVVEAWTRRGVEAAVYTHRWTDPPGQRPSYRIVTHRLGGEWSGPWDWRRIGRAHAAAWKAHDALFLHNFPSTLWYREAARQVGELPALWYCHEPPASLYPRGELGAGPVSDPLRASRLAASVGFYRERAAWRLYSRARRAWELRRAGRERWLERLRSLDRDAVGRVARLAANSRDSADRVRAVYRRDAVVVPPVPPDLDAFAPSPGQHKEDLVLWVGRMAPAKRPLLLLEAWARARPLNPALDSVRLVLVGDGPLRPAVEREAARIGGSVTCLHGLSREGLIDLYRKALLTVHLGLAEPFGLVPLESMAAGTAVLVEWEGGVRETVVPDVTGWTRSAIDVTSLAERLAAVPDSRSELRAMGLRGLDHVRAGFRFEDTLAAIEGLITQARTGT